MVKFMRAMDLEQVKEQLAEIKDLMQDTRFRKPWTRGHDSSPFLFMVVGAALGLLGMALYRNRQEVAGFCSNCGADIKQRWESSGLKEKAGRMVSKMKEAKERAQEGREDTANASARFQG